ncbi:MAG: D-2-hydroxyacid dehydrogenase, partial [Spirochaetales bacterium]|nr:D-2-hydroxyacid dehydrogenase [Spirochaetales bacterium]
RGTIVDEAALIRALQENRIAGAGLDVTVEEPTSMDNPLFGFENVIMTPHNAGSSEDSLVRASMAAARGCYAVINGLEVEEPAVVVK